MDNVILTITIGIFCFLLFTYYKEYKLMEVTKNDLEQKVRQLKGKVTYLQSYKDDVSRTFKILDNELMLIKDNISKQQTNEQVDVSLNIDDTNRISLLTPSVLSSLMSPEFMRDINQEPSEESNTLNRFLTVYLQNPNTNTTVNLEQNPNINAEQPC